MVQHQQRGVERGLHRLARLPPGGGPEQLKLDQRRRHLVVRPQDALRLPELNGTTRHTVAYFNASFRWRL
eukprot:1890981-Pyramimonas_sp.AAC.1